MFDSIREFWTETMEMPAARWVVWVSILLILVFAAIYVAKTFREWAIGGRPSTGERIIELKRLKEIGALNEVEYQRARNTLTKSDLEPVKFENADGDDGEKQAT